MWEKYSILRPENKINLSCGDSLNKTHQALRILLVRESCTAVFQSLFNNIHTRFFVLLAVLRSTQPAGRAVVKLEPSHMPRGVSES